MLKAAHLWEVSDIKSASKKEIEDFLTINSLEELVDSSSPHKNELFYKKYCLTNSGENGIWLCGTHHDMFDNDYFTFTSSDGQLHLLHFPSEKQKKAFIDSLKDGENTRIASQILSKETKAFLNSRNIMFSI